MSLAVPNIMGALARTGFLTTKKYYFSNYLGKKINLLVEQGLLRKINKNGSVYIELTKEGKERLQRYKTISSSRRRQKWDGKWRMLIFDVWEKRRRTRDILRYELKNFGFIQLQRSVWIYPYPCSEFIQLLKSDLRFGKNVRYIVVEKIDNDSSLKKHFKI